MTNRHHSPSKVRRFLGAIGAGAFYLGLVTATAWRIYPAVRFPATVAACVGAVLVLATVRPADRGKS
jgi:peptidoglycan/LPS O-acetylase OafA/YrhL